MKQSPTKNIILLCIMMIIGIGVPLLSLLLKPKEPEQIPTINPQEVVKEPVLEKVDIIDTTSDQRPYAVVVNNTPVAVKVQEGLKEAYLIYEFPTEGNTSRLMALYKTNKEITIGTIRSARHNFIDYAQENGAILACFGWSHYAKDEMQQNVIDYVNGIVHAGPFWRDNKENLAYEHTVYTTLNKLKDYANHFSQTTKIKTPYKINVSDVDLSSHENASSAKEVILNYGASNKEHFIYDEKSQTYLRNFNDEPSLDHETKEQVTTKNIIITKMAYKMCSDNHYWDLQDVSKGEGYYITNGKSVPIKWSKDSRNSQTKYTYLDGQEIEVSDGSTWIAIFIDGKEIQIL
ncbi:MAG: DUF3048 domain-containing protein [Bacilli bacterium]|nr:DUF3048 domain-containing protein [Bacilli bacterium]